MTDDGSATVYTGSSAHGQGHHTAWAMLVQDELGIPMDRITVIHGDTDLIPVGVGTYGSRSLQLGGSAVHKATVEVKDEARRHAAEMLEAAEADVVLDTSSGLWQVRGDPDTALSWAQVAGHTSGGSLIADVSFIQERPTFPFGTHVSVVEVDTETGQTKMVRHVTVDDAGIVMNPVLTEGQRHGGIAQGAAQALLEEVLYDSDGNPLTSTLADYAAISAPDLPSFELADSETPTDLNPLGVKGIGEAGTIGCDPGDPERRHQRRRASRRPAHRHADHTPAGVGGDQRGTEGESPVKVDLTVNGTNITADVEDRMLLVHFLRDVADLTGTNVGCDTTSCGACTVLLDGESVKSCTVLAAQADGPRSPPSRAWRRTGAAPRAGGLPRGARAPVRILHAGHGDGRRVAAQENPDPDEALIRHGLEGNLCRCTGYHNIVRAALAAADAAQGPRDPFPFDYRRAGSIDEATPPVRARRRRQDPGRRPLPPASHEAAPGDPGRARRRRPHDAVVCQRSGLLSRSAR